MKRRTRREILLTIAAIVFFPVKPGLAQSPAAQKPGARAQIESVLNGQQEAWNRGDIEAFLQGYWHSPELTFSGSSGTSRGWNDVLQRYQHNYPDRTAMGRLTFSRLQFRALGPKSYLVLGEWHLARAGGDLGGVFTLVFERRAEGWRIIHDHTSLVPAATSDKH